MPHPLGVEDLHPSTTSSTPLLELRAARPGAHRGDRQAQRGRLRRGQRARRPRAACPAAGRARRARRRWRGRVDGDGSSRTHASTLDAYLAKLAERGGIVEERIAGDEVRSPSVQLRVTPLGEVELLSTHDQLLGGPSGQSYLGCRFPADSGVRAGDHARGGEGRAAARREGRARPLRARLRRRARSGDAVGGRTRSRSTCARAARPTRSSRCSSSPTARYDADDGALPHPGRAREAPRGDRPPRGPSRCAACGSTTCSTSSPAPACTSTRRARPASSST